MPVSRTRFAFMMLASILLLGGCGSGIGGCDGDKSQQQQLNFSDANSGKEAPQYEQPTIANLQGKEQPFPAQYALPNYPNSRVTMAYVVPHLKPGQKNVVMLSSSDEEPTVDLYYREHLLKNGWTLTDQYEVPTFCYTIWTKKTDQGMQEVEVRVSPDPYGKQTIQLLAGPYRKITNDRRHNIPD